jgi:type IV fimbrial biogenesis protein FimT
MEMHGNGIGLHRRKGFTVLELLVTLVITAFLLLMAVPSFQQFTWRQQMKAAVGNLHNDLLLARSEAIFRNSNVVACPGDPAGGCADTSDWSGGWIVFADDSGDRQHQPAESLLRRGQVFEALTISGSAGRSRIRFLPDGSAPGSNGTIGLCGNGGPAQARKLVISNIGRIRRDQHAGINAADCPAS